jgi:hypothetical protein
MSNLRENIAPPQRLQPVTLAIVITLSANASSGVRGYCGSRRGSLLTS